MGNNKIFEIRDASDVGRLRRAVLEMAKVEGLNDENCGRLAIISNEISTNILKHSKSKGHVLVRKINIISRIGLEIIGIDKGVGIKNVSNAIKDGYSTAGSLGMGLGAIKRLSDSFDIYSNLKNGTAILSRVYENTNLSNIKDETFYNTGAVSVQMPGQEVCGDDWCIVNFKNKIMILIVDGLGHGYGASKASQSAIECFKNNLSFNLEELIYKLDKSLIGTRGAVLSIAFIDQENNNILYAGIGNISAKIISNNKQQSILTYDGMVGGNVITVKQLSYLLPENSILILNTDGLHSNISIEDYPGLSNRSASLIAGVIYRDYSRGNDDATVIIFKNTKDRKGLYEDNYSSNQD
jgi:anti-sigma regulatory factor (Ser/Thr protein kinase)